jgi:hypothetical protein
MSKTSQKPTNYNVIKVTNLNPSKLGTHKMPSGNFSNMGFFVNYNASADKKRTIFQTGKIKIIKGGIPRLTTDEDKKNHTPNDSKREFMRIPLDPEQPACVELKEALDKIQTWLEDKDTKSLLFGKNAKKYKAMEIYNSTDPNKLGDDSDDEDKDDDEEEEEVKPFIPTAKFRFDMEVKGENRKIKTAFCVNQDGKKSKISFDSVTEAAENITYLSDTIIGFTISRIWAGDAPMAGMKHLPYGIILKMLKLQYTPGMMSSSVNNDEIVFSDEEDEVDTITPTKPAKIIQAKPEPSKKPKKIITVDSDEDEDEENVEAEDEEEVDADEDDVVDSDDEGEVVNSDEEEEEEEEPEPEPVKKKATKKKAASPKK